MEVPMETNLTFGQQLKAARAAALKATRPAKRISERYPVDKVTPIGIEKKAVPAVPKPKTTPVDNKPYREKIIEERKAKSNEAANRKKQVRDILAARRATKEVKNKQRGRDKIFTIGPIDLSGRIPIKVEQMGNNTTIYIKPGQDIQAVINKWLNRDTEKITKF